MKDLFIISDIHGEINQFNELLTYWNPDTQQLIINGDLIDRGENSLAVVQLAMQLQKECSAVVLLGNHEELFLDWLNGADGQYCHPDTVSMIQSCLGETYPYDYGLDQCRQEMLKQFPEEMAFLRQLQVYYETNTHIIVHAGVDLELDNWKHTTASDMVWIRDEFHYGINNTGKTIVFGHTPTRTMRQPAVAHNGVWLSPCGTKIGIDGGAYFGGLLHGLVIDAAGHHVFSIDKQLDVTTTYALTRDN